MAEMSRKPVPVIEAPAPGSLSQSYRYRVCWSSSSSHFVPTSYRSMIGDPHTRTVRFLYKTILRLHRGLPPELSNLGTAYLKDEFKRHKTCDVVTASRFLAGWTDYALNLAQQLGITGLKSGSNIGDDLGVGYLDNFNNEQLAQLYELKKATKGAPE